MKKYINDKQTNIFNEDEQELQVQSLLASERPDAFEFKLELKLKAGNSTNTMTVAAGKCFGDRIEEVIDKQFRSAYFRARLRAIVGEPMAGDQTSFVDDE